MLEEWTGHVVGKMHIHMIPYKVLADELGWNVKYLSAVLNDHRKPKDAQEKIEATLNKIISNRN